MTTKTFYSGTDRRYEPSERVRYNKMAGIIWTERRLADGGWVHSGKQFAPLRATQDEIVALFGCDEEN